MDSLFDLPAEPCPLSEPERAYLAGIIDGEGCIFAAIRPDSIQLGLTIANTDRRLMDWLEARFPDVPRARPHLSKMRSKREKPVWYWSPTNRKMRPVLRAAWPYLVLKRGQADIAWQLIDSIRNHGRRGYPAGVRVERMRLAASIGVLNKKGPLDGGGT